QPRHFLSGTPNPPSWQFTQSSAPPIDACPVDNGPGAWARALFPSGSISARTKRGAALEIRGRNVTTVLTRTFPGRKPTAKRGPYPRYRSKDENRAVGGDCPPGPR